MKKKDTMDSLVCLILMQMFFVINIVQLANGYSFKNCIQDPNSPQQFKCNQRQESNVSVIVGDLPADAINLTIAFSPSVQHIVNESFAALPYLENLRMDNNNLNSIDMMAFHNLHHLKSLNLTCNNISELSPHLFTDLNNLTFLSLANNSLWQLHKNIFSPLRKLQTLILRQNMLSNFSDVTASVSHLENLTTLDVCFNNFTSLTHSNMSLPDSLRVLYICRNNLITLSCGPQFLQQIQVLDLSYNSKLPSMAFQGVNLRNINYLRLRSTNVGLELLNISNVKPSRIDFAGMRLNDTLVMQLCTLLKAKLNIIRDLNLSKNDIKDLKKTTLQKCPKIKGSLDLSSNNLNNFNNCLSFLEEQRDIQRFTAEHNHLKSLGSCHKTYTLPFQHLTEVSYRYNRILSVRAFAFYHMPNLKTLKLNINSIALLHKNALKGLSCLETLRLDNNLLTDLYNVSFEDLTSLRILNLRNNRISVIFKRTFFNLTNLNTLDLGGNKITQFYPGGLYGLKSLAKFYLDGNNLKEIKSTWFEFFKHKLRVLDLQRNHISFLSRDSYSPFVNLSQLRDLKLDEQMPYGMTYIPHGFFRGLYNLQQLYLTNNHFRELSADAFDDLKALRFLTLSNSCVGVSQLHPGVFKNLKNLTKLIVENMGIKGSSMSVFSNLTDLRVLQLNYNVMESIDVLDLEFLQNLTYLDLRNNPLTCTCDNSILQNWMLKNKSVQIVYLYDTPCQDSDKFFYNFDTRVCYIDLGQNIFFTTSTVIFLLTICPLLYVKLYWKMKYGYYIFCSWFSQQWRRLKEEEETCKYDAFVSYNSSDERWVLEQLLPNLEGHRSSFKLCLHHRDFELGRDIVSNIVSAVYDSRKTICVVSRNFLRSEWCSLEIQLASYRLFDEHRDILLPVLLEPISDRQLSSYHRMRKVMLKKTYLKWPGSDCTDPSKAQDLFWNQLRKALQSGSRVQEEEIGTADSKINCVHHDEKYCL